MVTRHALIYVGARIFAAVLNLLSVALFARLAGPSTFGQYLLFQASAFIVYGFTFQWLRMAFFAAYDNTRSPAIVSTFVQVAAASFATAAVLGGIAALAGFISAETYIGTLVATFGLAFFDCFYEIARARLQAGLVGRSVIARAVLIPLIGLAGFECTGTAVGLTAGVALAQIIAAAILLINVRDKLSMTFSSPVATELVRYGSPLVLAFGVNATGQTVDRLLLAKFESVTAMGPYGAVADVIKQSLLVTCEAVSGSYIPHAKVAFVERDDDRLRDVLNQAFRVYAFVTMFGSAVILTFGPAAIRIMFGEVYAQAADALIPIFTAATVFFVFRAYYFGQAIYFLDTASLELKTSIATVIAAAIAALMLIPRYGSVGAATALLIAQAAGCAVAMYAARQCRSMPYPVADFLAIAAVAIIAALGAKAVATLHVGILGVLALQGLVIGFAAIAIVIAFDIFGIGERVSQLFTTARFANRRGSPNR